MKELSNRKGKSITLKSTQRKPSSSKAMKVVEDSDEDEDESFQDDNDEKDEIAYLARRISKAYINKNKKKGLSLKGTKREKQSKMKLFALNAKNLDTSD